jgi:hypothetical protein
MRTRSHLVAVVAAVTFSSAATIVVAETKDALGLADNDSVYIDAKSFTIVPGKAKADTSALIKKFDARNLGPGAIVFRSGDKLYIADAAPIARSQLSDRYGSDRYGSDRYGSDRDTSASPAQTEREWQDYLRQSRRYGSDRYGSDRDTSASPAQEEREWQDYLRQSRRYGSDRDTSASPAQAEREWQDYLRQSRRYGSDRYGSDRDTSASPAQAEREWEEYLRQNRRYGSDRYGSDRYGSDRYGKDPAQQGSRIDDPENARARLKQDFEENWTTANSK